MTQNEKDILLKDLCARLPHGVKVEYNNSACEVLSIDSFHEELTIWKCPGTYPDVELEEAKPYLFPLSSMTMEQEREWQSLMVCDIYGIFYHTIESFDYLYKNHIDIRGLIPMGLANDATGLNIY